MTKNILKKLAQIAACGLLTSSALAEEVVKEQFIITATKSETEAREIGKSFTVINREEIENSNHHDLVNMLRRVTGLSIAKAGVNGTTGIYMRGHESHYTKLLLNGMPLEDASGTQTTYANIINSLSLDNIERIEIIKGPQSVLYGSDAIAGVINIITRTGRESDKLVSGSIKQEFGEDKFSKSTISAFGADGAFNYSLTLSHENQNSNSSSNTDAPSYIYNGDDDYYHNTSGNFTLGYKVNEFLSFGLTGSYFSTDIEFDNGAGHSENYIQNSTIRPSITLSNLMDGKLKTEISFNHTDHRRTNTAGGQSFSETHKYEVLNTFDLADWNTFSLGFELTEQFVDKESTTSTRVARYQEIYAQEQLNFDDRYFLTFGGRYSNHDQFGEHWTYQIAPAIYLEETGTKLHASFGTAYRAPSLFELFEPAIVYPGPYYFDGGDPNLKPEESEAFDIGFEQELLDKKMKLGATYFYSETDNKIAYVESIPFVRGQYSQFGMVRSYGFESFIEYNFTDDLFAKLTYTRTHTEYEHPSGDVLMPRVPKDAIHFLVNWQATDKLNFDGEIQYVGHSYSEYSNTNIIDSYTLAHLSASYEFTKELRAFAKIYNLFDEDYSEVYGFSTYGRSFFGGLEYKF